MKVKFGLVINVTLDINNCVLCKSIKYDIIPYAYIAKYNQDVYIFKNYNKMEKKLIELFKKEIKYS